VSKRLPQVKAKDVLRVAKKLGFEPDASQEAMLYIIRGSNKELGRENLTQT